MFHDNNEANLLKIIAEVVVKKIITTQKELAEAVGCTPTHLSNIKAKKKAASGDLYIRLGKIMGVDPIVLATGQKRTIHRTFREYFHAQKLRKIKEAGRAA